MGNWGTYDYVMMDDVGSPHRPHRPSKSEIQTAAKSSCVSYSRATKTTETGLVHYGVRVRPCRTDPERGLAPKAIKSVLQKQQNFHQREAEVVITVITSSLTAEERLKILHPIFMERVGGSDTLWGSSRWRVATLYFTDSGRTVEGIDTSLFVQTPW
jgi:hypothetical protein